MKNFERFLAEGVYDKHIFKVVFMAGGPGSGKSYAADKTVAGLGLKTINSDKSFTNLMAKAGLSQTMPDSEEMQRNAVLAQAKKVTALQTALALKGRLGMVIDGTGANYEIIQNQQKLFSRAGYDSYMIFVNTSLDTALQRNAKRDRNVPEKIVKSSWNAVQQNIGKFQRLFGARNFVIIDNNDPTEDLWQISSKNIRRLITKPIENWIALKWIKDELANKKKPGGVRYKT